MTHRSLRVASAFGVCMLSLGCGPEEGVVPEASLDSDATDADGTNGDDSPSSDGTDPGVEPAGCDVPEFDDDSEPRPFEELRAAVVDDAGDGVPDVLAQACGMNLCLFGSTDDTGYVLHQRSPAEQMRRVAFKYGDGLRYAQFARLLPDEPVVDLGQQSTMTLPAADDADAFEAGQTLVSEGIELTLAEDASVTFDLLTFPEDSDHRFVAAEMPQAVWPDALPADDRIGMVVALGPLKTEFCPHARLSLPNTPEWDAGDEVEVLLHITDTANHWGVFGEWAVVADGAVSEDGERIETNPESGLPQLGALAVRRVE